jgi:hypothetical protein
VSRIIGIVNAAFPSSSNSPSIGAEIADYIPVPIVRKRDGTIIIQYDPQQNTAGTTQALVRMYVNGERLSDITWDPLPNQHPLLGKRQVGTDPECTPVPTTMMTMVALAPDPTPTEDPAPTEDPTPTADSEPTADSQPKPPEVPPPTTTDNGGWMTETTFPLIPAGCTVLPCM